MSQTVALHPGGTFVPPDLLTPPASDERLGVMRDLAAFLLDRHLCRLARMRNPVELRLARLLQRMRAASGYLDLGYGRLADYVTERLGLSIRRMQVLLQMERRLANLPSIAAAFESGRINGSQVLLLLRVATPANEAAWLERSRHLNVRALEREVEAARASGEFSGRKEGGEPDPAERDTGAAATPPVAGGPLDTGGASGVGGTSGAVCISGVDATADEEDSGRPISFAAPDWLRGRWEWAVEVCRRASGRVEPVWRAAEYIAADYLAGVPDLPSLLARECGVEGTGTEGIPDTPHGVGTGSCRGSDGREDDGVSLFEEILRAFEEEHGSAGWVPPVEDLEIALPDSARDEACDTPRQLDERLRGLIRLRQNLSWHQGRLLRTFASRRLYRDLGFESLARYCRERLGLGLRRARQLISLERRLLELPAAARVYRSGALSWVRASLIARVASPSNEEDWIRLARSVTVRRLREEVDQAIVAVESAAGPAVARHGLPAGLDPEGRVRLRSPGWPRRPADEVQTSAPGGTEPGADTVQTSALGLPAEPESGLQLSAPASPAEPESGVQLSARPAGGFVTWTRVRFWAPGDVSDLWQHALRVCRMLEDRPLEDWECVVKLIDSFRRTWEVRGDPAWQRRYRVFERDGWRCRVPGCSSRSNLQEHHIVFRSQGGNDDENYLVALCATHHLQGIHAGRLRCHRLPEALLAWDLGSGSGDSPFERYVEDVRWEAARAAASPRLRAPVSGRAGGRGRGRGTPGRRRPAR